MANVPKKLPPTVSDNKKATQVSNIILSEVEKISKALDEERKKLTAWNAKDEALRKKGEIADVSERNRHEKNIRGLLRAETLAKKKEFKSYNFWQRRLIKGEMLWKKAQESGFIKSTKIFEHTAYAKSLKWMGHQWEKFQNNKYIAVVKSSYDRLRDHAISMFDEILGPTRRVYDIAKTAVVMAFNSVKALWPMLKSFGGLFQPLLEKLKGIFHKKEVTGIIKAEGKIEDEVEEVKEEVKSAKSEMIKSLLQIGSGVQKIGDSVEEIKGIESKIIESILQTGSGVQAIKDEIEETKSAKSKMIESILQTGSGVQTIGVDVRAILDSLRSDRAEDVEQAREVAQTTADQHAEALSAMADAKKLDIRKGKEDKKGGSFLSKIFDFFTSGGIGDIIGKALLITGAALLGAIIFKALADWFKEKFLGWWNKGGDAPDKGGLKEDETQKYITEKGLPAELQPLSDLTEAFKRTGEIKVPEEYKEAIKKYAAENDVTPEELATQLSLESDFNPKAINEKGYVGMGQFGEGALKDLKMTKEDAMNPYKAIEGTARYMKLNKKYSGGKLTDPLSYYMMHQQGAGGYKSLRGAITSGKSLDQMSESMQKQLKENLPPALKGRKEGAWTPQEWLAAWDQRYKDRYTAVSRSMRTSEAISTQDAGILPEVRTGIPVPVTPAEMAKPVPVDEAASAVRKNESDIIEAENKRWRDLYGLAPGKQPTTGDTNIVSSSSPTQIQTGSPGQSVPDPGNYNNLFPNSALWSTAFGTR